MAGPSRRSRRLKQGGFLNENSDVDLATAASDDDLFAFDSALSAWRATKSLVGDYDITGTLSVTDLTVTDDVSITDALTVGGAAALDSLSVTQGAVIGGAATLQSTLAVTDAATLSSTLSVAGALSGAGFSFSGNGTVAGTLGVTGLTTVEDLTVNGTLSVATLSLSGLLAVGGDLVVAGAALFDDTLSVAGALAAASLSTAGDLAVGGQAAVNYLTLSRRPSDPGGDADLFVHDGTDLENLTLEWGEKLVVYGETSIGDPGNEQGAITVNGNSYDAILKVNEFGGTRDAAAVFHRHSNTAGVSADIAFARARGTTASHSDVQNNDSLGRLIWAGWNSSSYYQGAIIRARVDGTPGTSDMPTELLFQTSADGSASPTIGARLSPGGTFHGYFEGDEVFAAEDQGIQIYHSSGSSSPRVLLADSPGGTERAQFAASGDAVIFDSLVGSLAGDLRFRLTNSSAGDTEKMRLDTNGVGFNGATPGRPTVTGSRGGNAALASLLTGLANIGLITNNTTA